MPPDLVEQLTAAGCFRMLVPTSHGGAELDLPALTRVLEELAQADGSVGWTVMIGCAAPVVLALLPRDTFDALYADGPDVTLAGAFNPTGVVTPEGDGFRVTGRWSFASGCQHADWFFAHCLVDDGREPPVRMMVLPPEDVEIKDTWSVSGLCGTGSHDFAVTGAFVPGNAPSSSRASRASTGPCIGYRSSHCRPLPSPAWPWASPRGPSTTSSRWPRTRCRRSATPRWRPTPSSSTSWVKRTPS